MLSATSEYALRALVVLVKAKPGQAVTTRELAESADVPPHYLAKVLSILKRAGFLRSSHGLQGGFQFEKSPGDVRLIDVVEQFEGIRAMPGCFFSRSRPCSDANPCAAHESWKGVQSVYTDFLEKTTLAQLAGGMDGKSKRKKTKKKSSKKRRRTGRKA